MSAILLGPTAGGLAIARHIQSLLPDAEILGRRGRINDPDVTPFDETTAVDMHDGSSPWVDPEHKL
jgi:hypothetical protein